MCFEINSSYIQEFKKKKKAKRTRYTILARKTYVKQNTSNIQSSIK